MKTCLIYIFVVSMLIYNAQSASFNVWAKYIRCIDANPTYMLNYTCQMKPVRGKCSQIDISIFVARIDRVMGRFRIFYKYTAEFRPYIIDFKFDACKLMNRTSPIWNNKAGILIIRGMQKVYGSLFKGCPYEGQYVSAKGFDVNETVASLLPPVIPTGTFRVQFDFFASTNFSESRHLISCLIDADVKQTKEFRATDFSMINMG